MISDRKPIVVTRVYQRPNTMLLSNFQKKTLDEDGFLVIKNLLNEKDLLNLRSLVDPFMKKGLRMDYIDNDNTKGVIKASNIFLIDACAEVCFTNKLILEAVSYILKGDFNLNTMTFRSPLLGYGDQPFHCDWLWPVQQGLFEVCNVAWMLDEFTSSNGATELIPGSHNWGKLPNLEDTSKYKSIIPEAPAGSALIFNSHVWHRGRKNDNGTWRRAIFTFFRKSQFNEFSRSLNILPEKVREEMSEFGKQLLSEGYIQSRY